MNYRSITAIFPSLYLKKVEKELKKVGVPGITVSQVHGFGEYKNFYVSDCMSDCVRIEVFAEKEKTDAIKSAIAQAVHQGATTDGVIVVAPVEELLHIREIA